MAGQETQESLVSDLANRIRRRIQGGSLAAGDFFMTEAQLAAEYDVSRTVAREAVSRLTAMGIVEARRRKGLVIRRPDPLRLFSESLPSLSSTSDLRELSRLRYVIEVGAIELTVQNAEPRQIEELERIVAAMATALRGGEPAAKVIALDYEFHALLLQMTGSPLIAGMQQVLAGFFAATSYTEPDPSEAERIVWAHQELFAAVRDRDVERARSMIRAHVRRQYLDQAAVPSVETPA